MLQLHARFDSKWDSEPVVLRVTTDPHRDRNLRPVEAFLVGPESIELPSEFGSCLAIAPQPADWRFANGTPQIHILPESLAYLTDGDIVYLQPRSGELWVLYRRSSPSNSMLLTERCNSRCLMCSQPPKDSDDFHLIETYFRAIPLMDPATPELGITGGEPTLLGPHLLDLIRECKTHLPHTALHMLSNGRLLSYLSLCQELAEIDHPDLMIGIPLYSDIASKHDFVVQAQGAFDETMRGIMNLERCGLRVELRVVLHRATVDRLPSLARFIARNLPFVEHIALMGLEMMGYVRINLESLWIDPFDYQPSLLAAVRTLTQHRMNVSIYNHQLCTLDEELWPYARKSISDWKNEYLEVCDHCAIRDACGGFFSSAKLRHSAHIHPVSASPPWPELPVITEI
ncbi:MAG: moaA 3 [Planctomycetaceae bacterium]|nr:moaA 3 [Planctomycetaceae bacterium]